MTRRPSKAGLRRVLSGEELRCAAIAFAVALAHPVQDPHDRACQTRNRKLLKEAVRYANAKREADA